jgi:hypothetical protein
MVTENKEDLEKIILTIKGKDIIIDTSKYTNATETSFWDDENKPSEDYLKMSEILFSVAMFIGKTLNEGPEVGNNELKRTALLSGIISQIVNTTFLSGYLKFGALSEVFYGNITDICGAPKFAQFLIDINNRSLAKSKTKINKYVS